MTGIYNLCLGEFTATQKQLFNGFPLSTMSKQTCLKCGLRVAPVRRGGDWVPSMHRLNLDLIPNSSSTKPQAMNSLSKLA